MRIKNNAEYYKIFMKKVKKEWPFLYMNNITPSHFTEQKNN